MSVDEYDPGIREILPHEKMFTLQIGNERFQLSGASLSSDAPSYFTNFFLPPLNRDKVLFIDRSPRIFYYIYSHLQGYHLDIETATDFTQVFNDALYFNLPALLQTLRRNDYYYAIVGGESIRIPKIVFNEKGNSPNFFSISNESLFRDLTDLLISKKLIRPPPQSAPIVNHCASLLKQLISLLQGIQIQIKSDEHRNSLIKEAKYYRFSRLAQQLIKNKIVYNPYLNKEEIIVILEHIEPKNVSLEENEFGLEVKGQGQGGINIIKKYEFSFQRTFLDEEPRYLQIQISSPQVSLTRSDDNDGNNFNISFHGSAQFKISKIINHLTNLNNMNQDELINDNNGLPVENQFGITLNGGTQLIKRNDLKDNVILLKCIISLNVKILSNNSKYFSVNLLQGDAVTNLDQFYLNSDRYLD